MPAANVSQPQCLTPRACVPIVVDASTCAHEGGPDLAHTLCKSQIRDHGVFTQHMCCPYPILTRPVRNDIRTTSGLACSTLRVRCSMSAAARLPKRHGRARRPLDECCTRNANLTGTPISLLCAWHRSPNFHHQCRNFIVTNGLASSSSTHA